jgi:hypothetical protein
MSGIMFDVEASGGYDVVIDSFDVHRFGGYAVHVYRTADGMSYVGRQSNATSWIWIAGAVPLARMPHTPSPLNLDLQYTIENGRRAGFYIMTPSAARIISTPGTSFGSTMAVDSFLTLFEGPGHYGPFNATTMSYIFNGTVHYHLSRPALMVSQTSMMQDLQVVLTSVPASAFEGFTLISLQTWMPLGQGPLLGLTPEPLTYTLLGIPYSPGNPFHFRAADVGVFPNAPFVVPAGGVANLSGMTIDFVCLLLRQNQVFDSASTVARLTFE